MQVRARGSAGGPHAPERLGALHTLPLGDRGRVEVEIECVEAETVVEDHQPTWEEELGDEGNPAGIGRDHRCPPRHRIVDAAVGRAGLAIDDPARAESGAGCGRPHGLRELPAPEPLRGNRPVEYREPLALGLRPPLGLGVEIDHRLRQREALQREITPRDQEPSLRAPRLAPLLDDPYPPRMGTRLHLQIDAQERGVTARIREEREGSAVHRAFDRRDLGDVLHVKPGDVTGPWLRRMPGDAGLLGRA